MGATIGRVANRICGGGFSHRLWDAEKIYSGNFLTKRKIAGGEEIDRRYGLCLETQFYPNFVNQPNFKGKTLEKDEEFYSKTEYRFRQN